MSVVAISFYLQFIKCDRKVKKITMVLLCFYVN